ncbi:MAG: hypothetical protein RR224_12055 [Clostridia bacterium]
MKNYQKLHYAAYHIMLSDGSSIKTTRCKCFASADPITVDNPYPQRWFYSPDGQLAIRLPRNELGEQYGKDNAAELKAEERSAERKNLCIGQTSHASCSVTCADCPFNTYCDSKYREANGAGCKRKCDCCSSYVRRTLDLDKPLGFNDDGTDVHFDLADDSVDIVATYDADEQSALIAAVIAALDPVDRELWYCLVSPLKKAEIAKLLHLTVDGVYYRQKRLEKLLREDETLKKIFTNF